MDNPRALESEAFEQASPSVARSRSSANFLVAGLFAGIGGFEEGFRQKTHRTALLCESDEAASLVLKDRFPDATLVGDIRDLSTLPPCDVVTAGFPCQDLSQVGQTKGITGNNSGLVNEVFRLLRSADDRTKWLVLENVPFMLRLQKGLAIKHVTDALTSLGWHWAYRIIDTRAFGLPQRRQRLYLVASRTHDPRPVLFGQNSAEPGTISQENAPRGFYWTEGHRGLGQASEAVPPLKGGSGLSIPSPPAVWFPDTGRIVVPTVEGAERLQGFEAGWTTAAKKVAVGDRARWKLIGNAVSVPVAAWIAERLSTTEVYYDHKDGNLSEDAPWPIAASNYKGRITSASVSTWPVKNKSPDLAAFLANDIQPLSLRAASGFLSRLEHSALQRDDVFSAGVREYVMTLRSKAEANTKPTPLDSNVSKRMAKTPAKDNESERNLRSKLYSLGYRFRVQYKPVQGLRRTADIAFPGLRIAIFVDGCFWHGCPIHGTWPKHNADWWREKIETNRKRDRDTDQQLKQAGWTVIRFWEHENADIIAGRISRVIDVKKSRQIKSEKKKKSSLIQAKAARRSAAE